MLEPLKLINIYLQLSLRIQEYFQNKAARRSSHQDAFFNITVLHLWRNYLKNTFDGVQFLVNLDPSKHFLFSKTSSRRLEDVFSVTIFVCQDLLKTSSFLFAIRLPKMSSRRLQDVFARRLVIISSRRFQDVLEDKKMLH